MRLSGERKELLDKTSHLEMQALEEQDRAERQLDAGYSRQYGKNVTQLEQDISARRRDAHRHFR
jgi:hypothetical protein